ncbi:Coiled-coil domain-containing protein 115 [Cryptotermes secundus]|uniref:Vacuolar ATPase assembly protein VMA22 n=2 Tax=Cryptotermes secundus TaxID=105785 RepID=A0A2J7QGJ9_9NEOP|nr:Coiled-coil domain-containing protein 115 [Cryptotermes secundus]
MKIYCILQMSDDILEVCKELDYLMIHALDLMEEQIKCKLKLQETMKSGCLNLAKARYIMGHNNISSLQLPTEDSAEIAAQRTVASSVETKKNFEYMVFKLHTINLAKMSSGEQEEGNSIRRRASKDGSESKGKEDLNCKKIEDNGLVIATDPIKWFGYLVPQNLRQAQKGFHAALELVVQSANIQSELEATHKRCDKLLKLKTALIAIKSEV